MTSAIQRSTSRLILIKIPSENVMSFPQGLIKIPMSLAVVGYYSVDWINLTNYSSQSFIIEI